MQVQEFDLEGRANLKALHLQLGKQSDSARATKLPHKSQVSKSLSGEHKRTEQVEGTGRLCTSCMPFKVTLRVPTQKASPHSLKKPEGKGSETLETAVTTWRPQTWPCG